MRQFGIKGELSKIDEELTELKEAHENKCYGLSIIESSDVIESVSQFAWKQYKIPAFALFVLYYLRIPYKFIRNKTRDFLGMSKT